MASVQVALSLGLASWRAGRVVRTDRGVHMAARLSGQVKTRLLDCTR